MKRKGFLLLALAALAVPGQAQVSNYYLTAGDQGQNWVVQGNSIINNFGQVTGNREYAIAVAGDIRTMGGIGPEIGARYSLGGADLGDRYAFPSGIGSMWDGTTDGTSNYSVDFSNGGVYRFDRNWANPSQLFTTSGNYLGITYDFTDNTLWISTWGNSVEHYTLNGTFISSFTTPFQNISCLALDHADGTLWMGSQSNQGTFFQYDKSGNLLNSFFDSTLAGQNTLGGEFDAVPEPASMAALGLGVLALVRRRRAK